MRVTTRVAPTLPRVQGDQERLRQLLWNLLTNAVKYTVAGDEVEVSAAKRTAPSPCRVRDHGPGHPAGRAGAHLREVRARESATAASRAPGLGLFIARSIAEAHGGRLRSSPRPGRGHVRPSAPAGAGLTPLGPDPPRPVAAQLARQGRHDRPRCGVDGQSKHVRAVVVTDRVEHAAGGAYIRQVELSGEDCFLVPGRSRDDLAIRCHDDRVAGLDPLAVFSSATPAHGRGSRRGSGRCGHKG